MPTIPATGTPRNFGTPKPLALKRKKEPLLLKDTVNRADRQSVLNIDRTNISATARATLQRLDDLEANMKQLVERFNESLEETIKNEAAVEDRVNGVIHALDVTAGKLSRRLNEILLTGTLAQRPAAAGLSRFYFATDQAVGARLSYDDPATGTWRAP